LNPAAVWAFSRPMGDVVPEEIEMSDPHQQRSLKERIDADVTFLRQVDQIPEEMIMSNYHISNVLGKGGYAEVFLAKLRDDADPWYAARYPKQLALKVMNRSQDASWEVREADSRRIIKEISFAKRFEAAGLHIYFISVSAASVTIAMEVAEDTLPTRLSFEEYPLEKRIRDLAIIANKLAIIEKEGIVHADLKPQNIMINSMGEPVITDFGLAKCCGEGPKAQGTPGFMAPEFWNGEYSSDVWALGVTSYLMVFEGQEPANTRNAAMNGLFSGDWLRLHEDPVYALALERALSMAPGDEFLERMRNIQKQTWIRDVLVLLDRMLQPSGRDRIRMRAVAQELVKLSANMRTLGALDLQEMLRECIYEIRVRNANCTGEAA